MSGAKRRKSKEIKAEDQESGEAQARPSRAASTRTRADAETLASQEPALKRQRTRSLSRAAEEPPIKVEAVSEASDDDVPLRRARSKSSRPTVAPKLSTRRSLRTIPDDVAQEEQEADLKPDPVTIIGNPGNEEAAEIEATEKEPEVAAQEEQPVAPSASETESGIEVPITTQDSLPQPGSRQAADLLVSEGFLSPSEQEAEGKLPAEEPPAEAVEEPQDKIGKATDGAKPGEALQEPAPLQEALVLSVEPAAFVPVKPETQDPSVALDPGPAHEAAKEEGPPNLPTQGDTPKGLEGANTSEAQPQGQGQESAAPPDVKPSDEGIEEPEETLSLEPPGQKLKRGAGRQDKALQSQESGGNKRGAGAAAGREPAAKRAKPGVQKQPRLTKTEALPVLEQEEKAGKATSTTPKAAAEPLKAAASEGPAIGAKAVSVPQHQDILARKSRLAEVQKQCQEIYTDAQKRAAPLLTQMMSDIRYLEGLTMTEEALQQTGVGKIISRLAKPLRPLQPLTEMERAAGALLAQWMKAVEGTPKAPPAVPEGGPKPLAGALRQAEPTLQKAPSTAEPQPANPGGPMSAQNTGSTQPSIRSSDAEELRNKARARSAAALGQPAGIQHTTEDRVRKRTRLFLEMAMLPPGYQIPPTTAAKTLEAALHRHFNEADLASGKQYLRRLKTLMDFLDPEGKQYQPGLREVVMTGKLHPADLACMSDKDITAEVEAHKKSLKV